jgi:hypothetical protein
MNIFSNTATNGAGIYQQGDALNITGGRIEDNRASSDGGGLYIASGEAHLFVPLNFNRAQAGNGGAIYNASPDRVVLDDASMALNIAGTHGGAVYNAPGSNSYITGVEFDFNTATGDGGGIYNNAAALEMLNNRLSGNRANNGAGIYITGNSLFASTNLGLFGNIADDDNGAGLGGGLYREGSRALLRSIMPLLLIIRQSARAAVFIIMSIARRLSAPVLSPSIRRLSAVESVLRAAAVGSTLFIPSKKPATIIRGRLTREVGVIFLMLTPVFLMVYLIMIHRLSMLYPITFLMLIRIFSFTAGKLSPSVSARKIWVGMSLATSVG